MLDAIPAAGKPRGALTLADTRCANSDEMRAFAVQSFGEAPAIHDPPIYAAGGVFLIRVRYADVNPIDYKLVEQLVPAAFSCESTSRILEGHAAN